MLHLENFKNLVSRKEFIIDNRKINNNNNNNRRKYHPNNNPYWLDLKEFMFT